MWINQNLSSTRSVWNVLLIVAALLITGSCSDKRGINGEQIIGLYKITETTCNVPESYKADCESVRFIELVKGKFYGVNDDEIAFVTWQGDSAGELQYLARKTPLANIKNFTGAQLGSL